MRIPTCRDASGLRAACWLAIVTLCAAVCGAVASETAHAATATGLVCVGDCNGDDQVTIDELVTGVNIALGAAALGQCPAFDSDASGEVTIDELVAAVSGALNGCTMAPPSPTPTPTTTASATNSPTFAGTATATPTITSTPTITPTAADLPSLVSSDPVADATDVPRSAWIHLAFDSTIDPAALRGFALTCDDTDHAVEVSLLAANVLIVNPSGQMPAAAACTLAWRDAQGAVTLPFSTAAAGAAATVRYDRTDTRAVAPFPDDFWLTTDASTRTGARLKFVLPDAARDVQNLYRAGLTETNKLDGFSPLAHYVIELSDAPDPTTLPLTAAASLDPLGTIGLFDLTPDSQTRGERVPFALEIHNDPSATGGTAHALLLFPSIPLTPGGRYGLVVTRRVLADATRPFDPSPFFVATMAPPTDNEPTAISVVRPLVADVLAAVAAAVPPIPADDIALALRFSVRSVDDIPLDLLSIKAQVLAAPPPAITVTSVVPGSGNSDVAAIVSGTWEDPDWRNGVNFVRGADGRPVLQRTRPVPFTLALPKAALQGPVPITMYQHGSPGSAEAEVPSQARLTLAGIGHAVIGFTDNLNREVSGGITDPTAAETAQVAQILIDTIGNRKVPDYYAETNAEQIAFVRMIQGLGTLDVLPIGAPDGVPDIDVSAPLTYIGISEGANHGPGLLPYAPEIRGAALVAGGSRLAETVIHQGSQIALGQIGPPLFPDVTPIDLWVVLSLFQTIADGQDPHNHARYIYRDPVMVAGTMQKASILLIEGLNDSLVPNNATNSLAWAMGPIPHLKPVQRVVPYLETIDGPVLKNIDADTTAAFFQYVPVGVEGIDPTPGCAALPISIGGEGHYCAQRAAESLHQREVFFQTTVSNGVPTIITPFAE